MVKSGEELRTEVRKVLQTVAAETGRSFTIRDDESIFLSGKLDSLSAIKVIMMLEQQSGLSLRESDFDISMIDSVNAIVSRLTA